MNLRDSYNENGYVIIENIINTKDVENIFDIFTKYLNSKKLINFIPETSFDLIK
jgi:ectoine hydroxylase-related dioxygenase (phytanoyl-CoA dioxygenase family)